MIADIIFDPPDDPIVKPASMIVIALLVTAGLIGLGIWVVKRMRRQPSTYRLMEQYADLVARHGPHSPQAQSLFLGHCYDKRFQAFAHRLNRANSRNTPEREGGPGNRPPVYNG